MQLYGNNLVENCDIHLEQAPSTVLFTPQKVFHSFGYDAEDKYMELAEENKHTNWYYFQRFKMLLHENKVNKNKSIVTGYVLLCFIDTIYINHVLRSGDCVT